jgi:hypothetical protein
VLFEAWVDPNLTRSRGNEAALDSPHGYSVNALMGSAAGAESRSGKDPVYPELASWAKFSRPLGTSDHIRASY